jgi:hypothetical protein
MLKATRWTARAIDILYALLWLSRIPGFVQSSAIQLPLRAINEIAVE